MRRLSKRDRVVFLLEHWNDFQAPAVSDGLRGVSDGGGGVPRLSPMCRHPSVVELTRCVGVLRRLGRGHAAHLLAFYGAEWRIAWVPVLSRDGKRLLDRAGELVTRPERRRVVPSWVELRMVERGVDVVSGLFNGEVFIPDELLAEIAA